jgi:hypothetical protein
MKRFISWCKKYKFQLLLGAFSLLVILFFYIMLQSLKKDHTMEMTLQKLQLKEENRQQIEKERQVWADVLKGMNDNMRYVLSRDSAVAASVLEINERINELKISKQYHEKIKAIDTYSNIQLLEYLRDLPRLPDNDY